MYASKNNEIASQKNTKKIDVRHVSNICFGIFSIDVQVQIILPL